jgi:tetratricopeptide (TPR) repeat protein
MPSLAQVISWRALLLPVSLTVFATLCRTAAQEVPPAKPATVEAHLGRGYDALKNERYELSADEFRAALAIDSTLVERARFPLAVALFELHQSAEARREFVSLHRELGEHPNIVYYLGRLDLEDGDLKGATQNLRKAAAKPPFPDTAFYLGVAFLKQHDLSDAEKWLKAAAQLLPRDSRVEFQLAKVYREQGRDEEAKQALAHSSELRRREDNDVRLKQECAEKLEQHEGAEASAACEQLYDPNNAEKLTSLGTIYGQHGDLEAALKCFRRAAELAPQSPQMQYNLALTYYQLNQFANARAPLEAALKRWPDLFQLNALYGAVLAKLGADTSAYQALHNAYELNPQDSGTANMLYLTALQLARKSEEAGDYSHSLTYLQEAAKLRPEQPDPHRRMAKIYSLTAHSAQAAAEEREADRLNKNSPN